MKTGIFHKHTLNQGTGLFYGFAVKDNEIFLWLHYSSINKFVHQQRSILQMLQGILTPFDRLEGFERKQRDDAGRSAHDDIAKMQSSEAAALPGKVL